MHPHYTYKKHLNQFSKLINFKKKFSKFKIKILHHLNRFLASHSVISIPNCTGPKSHIFRATILQLNYRIVLTFTSPDRL
uniref:Uncharacterized protein n=1 Tax=Arundo donax TaxID=35708 RepID=A0A0A9GW60_ARUDO